MVVVELREGGNLVADLLVIDARPDSLEFGIRDGSAIRRLSDFTGWRFAT